jgi:hypothetical protein
VSCFFSSKAIAASWEGGKEREREVGRSTCKELGVLFSVGSSYQYKEANNVLYMCAKKKQDSESQVICPKDWECSSMVEHFLSLHKALGSIPSFWEGRKEKKNRFAQGKSRLGIGSNS